MISALPEMTAEDLSDERFSPWVAALFLSGCEPERFGVSVYRRAAPYRCELRYAPGAVMLCWVPANSACPMREEVSWR